MSKSNKARKQQGVAGFIADAYDELNRRREAIDWDALRRQQAAEIAGSIDRLGASALRIKQQRDALARAVLMFHSSSPWTAEKRFEWQALAGTEEATTRTLCDFARRCLKAGE